MVIVPALAASVLIVLLGFGLLIYGIGRIVVGGTAVNANMALRALLILFGALIVIFSFIVIVFPTVGVYTYGSFAAIAFTIIGLDSLASGIIGLPLT
jgi:uncharacterized membrane protein HdeD (DUF308 family)